MLTPKLSICWNVIVGCDRKFTNSTDIYDGMNIIWYKWNTMLVRRIFIGVILNDYGPQTKELLTKNIFQNFKLKENDKYMHKGADKYK